MKKLLYNIYGSACGEVVKCCKCGKEMNHYWAETPVARCYDCFLKDAAEKDARRREYEKQQANIVVGFPEILGLDDGGWDL